MSRLYFLLFVVGMVAVGWFLAGQFPRRARRVYEKFDLVKGLIGGVFLIGWAWMLMRFGAFGMFLSALALAMGGLYLYFERPHETIR